MEPTFPTEVTFRQQPSEVFGVCFMLIIIFVSLAINILYVIAFCKIFGKAGYHWALGLLMLVPIANLIMPLVLAFGQWPVLQQAQSSGLSSQPAPAPASPPPGDF